jgi:hypothetical protein
MNEADIPSAPDIQAMARGQRQRTAAAWCARAFGDESLADRRKRALRLLEEAIELYQAEQGSQDQAGALVAHVFGKPAGEPAQEVGGVSLTLLSYCHAAGLDADGCEAAELARVLAEPLQDFQARYARKTQAGF